MAEFLLRNSLNPHKVVKCGVTLTQYVDYKKHNGEPIWLLAVGTSEEHKNGGAINEVYTNLTSLETIDKEIELLVAKISKQIDWGGLSDDEHPPFVDSAYPVDYIAKMEDPVEFVIKELMPSTGIDLDTLKITANGLDITDEFEIKGNPYEYHLKWRPQIKVYDVYD